MFLRHRSWRVATRPVTLLLLPLLCVTSIIVAGAGSQTADAQTAASVVSAIVPSTTTIDPSDCTGSALQLGVIYPTVAQATTAPCTIKFGSSNDSASLLATQADHAGNALTQGDTTLHRLNGAPAFLGATAPSASVAWEVGQPAVDNQNAPIWRTDDGGATWQHQTSCAGSNTLQDVSAIDTQTAVAVGDSGTICRTTDGGATWTSVTSPTSGSLSTVTMLPDGTGWTAGPTNRIFRTTDGGLTWAAISPSYGGYWYTSIAASPDIDPVSGNHTLYIAVAEPTATPGEYKNAVLTSTNNGASWSSFTTHTAIGFWRAHVTAIDYKTAFVSSAVGIFSTTNEGGTWTQHATTGPALCTTALSSGVWLESFSPSLNYRSADQGATWTKIIANADTTSFMRACAAFGTTAFFGGGNAKQYTASDPTGTSTTLTNTVSPYHDQNGIAAWSSQHFLSVGNVGSARLTNDSGASFTTPDMQTTHDLDAAVAFTTQAGTQIAIAVGDAGTIVRTTDGGSTFSQVTSPTANPLTAVARAHDGRNYLYAVGSSGTVLKSTDDGATWSTCTVPGPASLSTLAVISSDMLWVAGTSGKIYRTNDACATWTNLNSTVSYNITGIASLDGVHAVATIANDGSGNAWMLTTSDSGATWTATEAPLSTVYFAIAYIDQNTLVRSENGSTYSLSTDGGSTWTSHAMPISASLHSLDVIDAHDILFVGSNDAIAAVRPGADFADYDLGTNDFSLPNTSAFGACLETAINTVATNWADAGSGNCITAHTTDWQPIAQNPSGASAVIASSGSGVSDAKATLFFAAQAANATPIGDYQATITFEVRAPNV